MSQGFTLYANQKENIYSANWVGGGWLGSLFPSFRTHNITTYGIKDLITRPYSQQFTTKSNFGLLWVEIKQGTETCSDTWDQKNLTFVLATVGGFLGSAWLIISFLLSGYISFTFDKSMIKRLYTNRSNYPSKKVEPNNTDEVKRDDQSEFIYRVKQR